MLARPRFLGSLAALAAAPAAAAAATPSGTPYKIGVTFPLTGPLAPSGLQYLPGIEVGVNHVNRAGGIKGHPLQLVVEDTGGTPQGGVSAMRKVAQVDGVQAIITIYTNVVTAQMPLADQLKVPFLCPVQTPNLMNKSQYGFSHAETIASAGLLYRDYWKAKHIKRIFAFMPNNAIGPVYSAAYKGAAEAAGAEYSETVYNYGENDYRGLVARAKAFAPDSIVIATQGGIDDTTILRQLREAGVNAQVDLSGNFFEETAWRAAIGTYIESVVFSGVAIHPVAGKQFIDDYRIQTGHPPAPIAAEVYDMVRMIAAAIDRSSYNGEAIRDQLATLKGVPSAFGGTISMDPDHYSVPSTNSLWLARGGKLVVAK